MCDKTNKMAFVLSKDISFYGIDDFITSTFHHGKVMTMAEYEKYHSEGKDVNENVEFAELTEKCWEWCQECEDEVELDTRFEMQICPSCGKPIAPCNLCSGRCITPCPLGCR
jgi:hypothetical protein